MIGRRLVILGGVALGLGGAGAILVARFVGSVGAPRRRG